MNRADLMSLQCLNCDQRYPFQFKTRCDSCKGAVDIVYNLSHVRIGKNGTIFERYGSLLPASHSDFEKSYGEGNTPLIHLREFGRSLELNNVFIKVEGNNPTGTTKDRMAAVSLSYLASTGVKEIAASSTGNSSTSYAHYASRRKDVRVHIFMADSFLPHYKAVNSSHVLLHSVRGNFADAEISAGNFARENGLVSEGGFFNPGRREGLKTAIFEAYDELGRDFDWLFQSISSGMGIVASYKGVAEYIALGRAGKHPHLVCCQQKTNAPMVTAFEADSDFIRDVDKVSLPHGLAHALLRGDPSASYPLVRSVVLKTGGTMRSVSEEDVRKTLERLRNLEGLLVGPAAGVSLATLTKLAQQKEINKNHYILVNATDSYIPSLRH